MTELEIYKFIHEEHNGIGYEWIDEDVYCWVDFDKLRDFVKFFKLDNDDLIDVRVLSDSVCFEMDEILEMFNIELLNIFEK